MEVNGVGEPDEPRPAPVEADALDHLWNAAHEMLQAMRGLLEAADEFVEAQRARPAARAADSPRDGRDGREGRVHRIDIDRIAGDDARSDVS
jgi:hypothetical protein